MSTWSADGQRSALLVTEVHMHLLSLLGFSIIESELDVKHLQLHHLVLSPHVSITARPCF